MMMMMLLQSDLYDISAIQSFELPTQPYLIQRRNVKIHLRKLPDPSPQSPPIVDNCALPETGR